MRSTPLRVRKIEVSAAYPAANGSNPIGIFVPCHRVLAADLTLHGYGGGLERKAWLLDHEGASWRAGREAREEPQLPLFAAGGMR